jgi:hypothetical protein
LDRKDDEAAFLAAYYTECLAIARGDESRARSGLTLPEAIRECGGIRRASTETLTGELRILREESGLLYLFNQRGHTLDELTLRLRPLGWDFETPDALVEALRDYAFARAKAR